MARPWHQPVAALALLLVVALAEAAGDAYRQGLEAVDQERWEDAARLMRAAISEQPIAGGKVRLYGMNYADYTPYYYLGLALFRMGECEEALAAWTASETQGAIRRKADLYAALRRDRASCDARLAAERATPEAVRTDPAELAAARGAAEAAVSRAREAAGAIQPIRVDPSLADSWPGDPELGGLERQGLAVLDDAQAQLETGSARSELDTLEAAGRAADRARELLETARANGLARRADLQRRREATPTPPPRTTPTPGPAPRPSPPAALRSAAAAYLAGRYRDALAGLEGGGQLSGPERAQGLLFRAAAGYAIYLLGGERDAELLRRAQRDARDCQALDGSLSPDPRAFSPRFRQFFAAAGEAASARRLEPDHR